MISIVVLAAGMGERLRPITETAPKPLIKISENESIMSNNVKKLSRLEGLQRLYIIGGYFFSEIRKFVDENSALFEKFERGVQLVNNPFFYYTNNMSSMIALNTSSAIRDDHADIVVVLDGDVICTDELVETIGRIGESKIITHFWKAQGEWYFEGGKYHVSSELKEEYYMAGVSCWRRDDFFNVLDRCMVSDLASYWDIVAIDYLFERKDDIDYRCNRKLTDEIDTIEDLIAYLGPERVHIIANQISASGASIKLGGLTNLNYLVTYEKSAYVLRLPGVGTEKIVNRRREELTTNNALEYTVPTLFYSGGAVKMTEYVPGARFFDPNDMKQLVDVLHLLSDMHKKPFLDLRLSRDLEAELLVYERVIKENLGNINPFDYEKYRRLRPSAMPMIQEAAAHPKALTHGDLLPDNILVKPDGGIVLIDFEYAGCVSPYWDYASLMLENNIEPDHVIIQGLIHDPEMLLFYLVVVEFIWSAWGLWSVARGKAEHAEYARMRINRCEKWLRIYEAKREW